MNEYVFDFMTQVRLLKGKQLPKRYKSDVSPAATNLLIRHTPKNQNHNGGRERQARINLGAAYLPYLASTSEYAVEISSISMREYHTF